MHQNIFGFLTRTIYDNHDISPSVLNSFNNIILDHFIQFSISFICQIGWCVYEFIWYLLIISSTWIFIVIFFNLPFYYSKKRRYIINNDHSDILTISKGLFVPWLNFKQIMTIQINNHLLWVKSNKNPGYIYQSIFSKLMSSDS